MTEKEKQNFSKIFTGIVSAFLTLAALYLASLYDFLLFHSMAELFSIVIAFGMFAVAWNSRRFLDNQFLLVIGIAYLFIGCLDRDILTSGSDRDTSEI
jgi:hypothetical protein